MLMCIIEKKVSAEVEIKNEKKKEKKEKGS
jgi:hypothetical protein